MLRCISKNNTRTARTAAYGAPDTSLRAKILAVKDATKSQYGSQSPQYLEFKGIKVQGSLPMEAHTDGVLSSLKTASFRSPPGFLELGGRTTPAEQEHGPGTEHYQRGGRLGDWQAKDF